MEGREWGRAAERQRSRSRSKTEQESSQVTAGAWPTGKEQRKEAEQAGRASQGRPSDEALLSSVGTLGSMLSLQGVQLWANKVMPSSWLGGPGRAWRQIEGWTEPPDTVATASLPVSSGLDRGSGTQLLAALAASHATGLHTTCGLGSSCSRALGVFIPKGLLTQGW